MTIPRAARSEHGFTLIELMMGVMFVGILGAMALFEIGSARPALVADGVMRTVMAQLNLARETAVAQRRQIDVVFDQDKTCRRQPAAPCWPKRRSRAAFGSACRRRFPRTRRTSSGRARR